MRLFNIALVGRPNVGKSSLLNRLAGRRISIVDPTPGVTRDRVTAVIPLAPPKSTGRFAAQGEDRARRRARRSSTDSTPSVPSPPLFAELTDTGGLGVYVAHGKRFDDVGADLSTLNASIESQIARAIDLADLVLFIVDARDDLTSLDRAVADLLRARNASAKVLLVANKTDSAKWETHAAEFSALGFGPPFCVSAAKGLGLLRLRNELWSRARLFNSSPHSSAVASTDPAASPQPDADVLLAIVGKRNAGKSSLVNAWAGEERVIVSEIAGTTRDAIDVRFNLDGKSILAIDTAGLRKRKSFADDVELYAFDRMRSAIDRADVALLLIDASVPISQIDKQLAGELAKRFKPTIIVVTKSDVLQGKDASPQEFQDYITRQLPGLEFAPIIFVCAHQRRGLAELLSLALNLKTQALHRESTGRLNAAVQKIMARRGPGLRAKVLFVTQIGVNPPTIVFMVNQPDLFEGAYERYLLNALREHLPFSEVPIRLQFTKRKRIGLEQLKARAGSRPDSPRTRSPKPSPKLPRKSTPRAARPVRRKKR